MDHRTAETNLLVEKYISEELSEQERNDFEEHMFDCPICSEQVRQDFTLIENLKAITPDQLPVQAAIRRASWRDWLRVPSLAPSLTALALACIVGYQNFSGGANGRSDIARVLPVSAVLTPSVTRGAETGISIDRNAPTFILNFSVDADRPDAFECEFDSASGDKLLSVKTPHEATASLTLPIELPTKSFPPGRYHMVLRAASEPDRIVTYPFVIQNSNN